MPDYEIINKIAHQIIAGLNGPKGSTFDHATPNFSAYVSLTMIYSIECSSTYIKVYEWVGAEGLYQNKRPWAVTIEVPLADPECIEKAIKEAKRIKCEI